jgi:GrpB-like predicted nucleotidyltransferase (UPF0157 family)
MRPQVESAQATVQAILDALRIPGELVLVGGSSVPGALTRGDIDLHLRVSSDDFSRIASMLKDVFDVVHPEIWASTLATFDVSRDPPVGLAVTPRGSEHDRRFTRSWQLIAADPGLVQAYNEVKQSAPDDEYEARKSDFFDMVLALWPTHPDGGLHNVPDEGEKPSG